MQTAYFIIGASGSGKTTAVKMLQEIYPQKFNYFYFDNIGVPAEKEMIRDYGTGENWQKEMIKLWAKRIKESIRFAPTILDGQIRPSFIKEACEEIFIPVFEIILFDCTDGVREQRLAERGQPELANKKMMNWAKYLRDESLLNGYKIIDNTNYSIQQSLEKFSDLIMLP